MLAGESVDRGGGKKREFAEGIGEKPRRYKWNIVKDCTVEQS